MFAKTDQLRITLLGGSGRTIKTNPPDVPSRQYKYHRSLEVIPNLAVNEDR